MNTIRLGIVGTGMIAGIIANSAKNANNIEVVAVTSRKEENAKNFAQEHNIKEVFTSYKQMLESNSIDAVYIATPTSVKEEIALFAAKNKKHLLVDKPFASLESLQNIVNAAKDNNLAFMDATHFTNNPRTSYLKDEIENQIGEAQAVRTSFFFPFMNRENIRFDVTKEPSGVVGDMAWYNLRAVVEYLQPTSAIKTIAGGIVRDEITNSVIRGSGVVVFEDGKSSTFDFGYNAGVCLMDLDILGHKGSISLDDYVLDWKSSFAFNDENHDLGYTKKEAMAQPKDFEYIKVQSNKAQDSLMLENLVEYINNPNSKKALNAVDLALKTQELVDAYWNSVK